MWAAARTKDSHTKKFATTNLVPPSPCLQKCFAETLRSSRLEGRSHLSPCSVQFSHSVMSLWDPMNRSMTGLPVHHQLPEFTQIHVRRVSDAIQPSYPLSSPSPPAPQPFPASRSFQLSQLIASGGQNIGVSASTSVLPMNTQD